MEEITMNTLLLNTITICIMIFFVLPSISEARTGDGLQQDEILHESATEAFSFTNDNKIYEQDFNEYRGIEETIPDYMWVTWNEDRLEDPFGGVGNFNTSDPDESYGNFTAYTSDNIDFSFGIRERAPDDLRDARLFFAFTNNTDEPVSTFEVSYDVEAWYIGDRRNRIRLKYDNLLTSTERETFETDIFSTDNPSSTTGRDTKVDGSLEENRVTVTGLVDITTIDDGTGNNFAPLEPGETAYFRWQFSNAEGDGGSLRSGLAINNLVISIYEEVETFSFTNDNKTYEQDFNEYRGTEETLPSFMWVTWDRGRLGDPWGGVGNFETSDPGVSYGNLSAYTSNNVDFSFGIRERAPDDLRDARLFFAFTNNTDEPVSTFEVSYDVEAWYIGDRRNRIRLKYDDLLESDERETFETDLFSTDNPSSTTTPGTKVDGSLEENRVTVTGLVDITTIDDGTGNSFAPLAPGETAYFRWQFSNAEGDGGSLRSGLAINNLVISIYDNATSTESGVAIPGKFVLSQNYPNPFNPTTQISYELPEFAEVRLEVFNIRGQRVATLINGTQNAGNYTVTFDASSLASGVYMYRLQTGSTIITRKMTLIR